MASDKKGSHKNSTKEYVTGSRNIQSIIVFVINAIF
jgi:hypothetical protein